MTTQKKIVWAVSDKHRALVLRFLEDGFSDYLAARVLLNSGLLPQGAILASTAIEKYFKAMLASKGNQSRGHLKNAHWYGVQHIAPDLYSQMNVTFLKLCQKCYEMRYSDQLPVSFNVAIADREFLAELDATALLIEYSMDRRGPLDAPVITRLTHLLSLNDERLLQDNHVIAKGNKEAFIYASPQLVFEIRKLANGAFLDVLYKSVSRPRDSSFLRDALVPSGDDGRSFKFSHLPSESGLIDGGH